MINSQFNKSSITIWSIKYSPISKILLYLHVMIKNIAYDYIKNPIHTTSSAVYFNTSLSSGVAVILKE